MLHSVRLCALLAAVGSLASQDVAALREDLASESQATVAWAAYTAGKDRVQDLEPDLRRALARVRARPLPRAQQLATARAILDALITLGRSVPAMELAPWRERFPEEVLILAARDPKDAADLLRRWALGGEVDDARWCALWNLLCAGDPAFVAHRFCARLKTELHFRVVSAAGLRGGGGRVSFQCGGPPYSRLPEFPPVTVYQVRWFDGFVRPGWTRFARGASCDVAWKRTESPEARFTVDGCRSGANRDEFVLDTLGELSDRPFDRAVLAPHVWRSLVWRDLAALHHDARAELRALDDAFREVAAALQGKRLLPRGPLPTLNVTLTWSDARTGELDPLPNWTADQLRDPRSAPSKEPAPRDR